MGRAEPRSVGADLPNLVLGGVVGSKIDFYAGWFAGAEQAGHNFTEQLQGVAARVVTEQKCQQQMSEARISGSTKEERRHHTRV
jgi:hypothetical protein